MDAERTIPVIGQSRRLNAGYAGNDRPLGQKAAGAVSAYTLGETVQVTLTFSEAVEVTGKPGLKFDLKPESGGEDQPRWGDSTIRTTRTRRAGTRGGRGTRAAAARTP